MLTEPLFQAIVATLRSISPRDAAIRSIAPVSGGDIHRAFRIEAEESTYFVKVNDVPDAVRMFLAESNGLATLGRVPGVRVPRTFTVGQAHGEAFLLMEWLDPSPHPAHAPAAQEQLGRMVATLHRQQSASHGQDHDNFIGTLPQRNTPTTSWTEFFISQRLETQLEAAARWVAGTDLPKRFEQLFSRLDALYPPEPPALLHGDLWGGNYLLTPRDQPVLIDPAVYYGNREMDIAMTKLFGGFSESFYAAYHEAYPLQPGWEERVDLWNLYPLLVHLNLFGLSYLDSVKRHVKKYG